MIPTRSSFHSTRRISPASISPTAMPRMIMVLLWLPALPPVSVSMGIKVTSSGITANAASYLARILPVIMLLTIRIKSQASLFFARTNTPVFRYGFSLGIMAAIFSKSSVASCSMTSTTSSTVTIPTRRSSWSTTGRLKRSYLRKLSATSSWSSVVTALITWVSMMLPMTSSYGFISRSFTVTTPSNVRFASIT